MGDDNYCHGVSDWIYGCGHRRRSRPYHPFRWNGIDVKFGYAGAIISFLSVFLGNIFSIIGFIAASEHLGFAETMFGMDYTYMPEIMKEWFSVVDLLFYGIAVYEGYRFSFRIVTERKLEELMSKK